MLSHAREIIIRIIDGIIDSAYAVRLTPKDNAAHHRTCQRHLADEPAQSLKIQPKSTCHKL